MNERVIIEEVFPNGVMSMMKHISAEKVAQLFATDDDIDAFDAFFMEANGGRTISYGLKYYSSRNQTDTFLTSVLWRYFPNWLRIKEALDAEYDLLWTGGGDSKTTETRHEAGTNKGSASVQNQLNAFNGDTASDTDNQSRSDEGEHDVTTTVERAVERKENSVTYTQAEVVEKELALRMRHRFFDVVANDIANSACAVIYD